MAVLSIEARALDHPPELGATYRATFARLAGLFRARGCPPDEAADLAQEAALRACLHLRRWGVDGGVDALLNRIARNLLIDRARVPGLRSLPLENAEDLQDPAQDPSEVVDLRQRRRAVRRAVLDLPGRHREAIALSLEGMSPAEVGARLGIGRNAAYQLLHRARRSLRDRLRGAGEGSWGIVAALGARIRSLRRRASEAAGALQPLAVAAEATPMAVAILFATLALAAPAAARSTLDAGSTLAAVASPAGANAAADDRDGHAVPAARGHGPEVLIPGVLPAGPGLAAEGEFDARDHRMELRVRFHNPAGGADEEHTIKVWQERDPSDRGTVGTALDQSTLAACGEEPSPCGTHDVDARS